MNLKINIQKAIYQTGGKYAHGRRLVQGACETLHKPRGVQGVNKKGSGVMRGNLMSGST